MAVIDETTPEGKRFYQELKKLGELMSYAGFQQGQGSSEDGVDLVDIAAFNEVGTSRAPSRPFMRKSVDDNKDKIIAFCQAQIGKLCDGTTTAEQILKEIAVFQKGLIQETIVDGEFEPNAESTIRKKKSDKPLIDTGRMRQSVMTVIDKKGRA
jgi:hypothetical protein